MKFQAFVTKCTIYFDDVFIFSDLFKRLLSNFSVIKILGRLQKWKLVMSHVMCIFVSIQYVLHQNKGESVVPSWSIALDTVCVNFLPFFHIFPSLVQTKPK